MFGIINLMKQIKLDDLHVLPPQGQLLGMALALHLILKSFLITLKW
jgi:hypothetical protein